MATKTLGVKFEIAGLKEAQAGLNTFRNNLNQSLAHNKKAAAQSIRISNTNNTPNKQPIRQRGEQPYDFIDNYQRTIHAVRQKQYQQAVNIYARPRINRTIGGFFEGIGNSAGGRAFDKIDNLFRKLTGREEHREIVDLSTRTIDKIGFSVARALSGKSTGQSQRDKNMGINPRFSFGNRGIGSKLLDQAMMPIRTVQYSFFEGIGSNFGNRFAEGLNKVLNEDLDFSFERKGRAAGKGISYTATEGVDKFKQDVFAVGNNYNDLRYSVEDGRTEEASKKFDTLFKSITKSITSIADSYLRGFRKGSVQLEGLRRIEGEINKQNNQAPDLTGKKRAIFTVSGFAGEKGKRGEYMAEQLKPYVKDDTAVIGAENKFTDVLSPADKNVVLWGISALASLAKINLKGFNPDAVELAAKVVNTLSANPDIEVDLLGHSAGGFVVEEAQEILNQLGYGDKVTSRTVGTPIMSGNLDAEGVDKILGDDDWRIKPLEEALEYFGAAKPTEKVVSGVKDHFFKDYLDSDEFLEEILGDSLDKDKLKAQKKNKSPFKGKLIELETLYKKYISTIYQNLDDLGEELSIAPDRLIAKNRREKLRDRGGKEVDRKLREKDFKAINLKEETETAVLVIGGFSGAKGRSGAAFAKRLNGLVEDDKTQYIGVRNPFTDVLTSDDIRNPDPQKSIPKILEMFGKVHQIGYNPDAAEIAAQAMDLLQKNPNLNVKVAGYSGGGYVAEDLYELLNSQGADMSHVEVMGVGTPELPGGIKNRDFNKIMGDQDPIMMADQLKAINNQVKSILGFDIFPELMSKLQNVEGIDSHDIDEYVAGSSEVQDFFYGHIPKSQELIGNYAQINDLKSQIDPLGNEMMSIKDDESLDSGERFERLREIRQQYIDLIKQIHSIAKYSQSIGGGKAFADDREFAATELEMAGIIVEPIEDEQIADPWDDVAESETKVVNNRAKNLANAYSDYLKNIGKKTKKDSVVNSEVIARDFASLDKAGQENYLKLIRRTFTNKSKLYRKAVKNGQLEAAKKQAESLLVLSNLIKNLYAELADFEQLDPQVKADFKNYQRYATSVETEIISGSNGNGRINQGLPDIAEEQITAFEQDGENVSEGFIYGILDSLAEAREAGEQLGESVRQGTEDSLDIQSPSKVFKTLGKWVVAGFRQGLAEFDQVGDDLEKKGRKVVKEAQTGVKQQIKKGRINLLRNLFDFGKQGVNNAQRNSPQVKGKINDAIRQAHQEISEISEDIREEFSEELSDLQSFVQEHQDKFLANNIGGFLDSAGAGIIQRIGSSLSEATNNEQFDQALGNIGELIGKFVRLIVTFKLLKIGLDALGLGKFISAFRNLPEEALNAAIAVESLDNRIVQMSGSAQAGAKNLAFITDEAARLNRNLIDAKENFSQVLRATRDTSLEGFQSENIYTAFAATAKANALSQADEQQLFRSVRSMIGKGILSQEEVRQEIGERLGDFEQSLAEAYGVSRPQLNKMIEDRQIIASEALPKVSAVLRAKNDISGDLDTGAAAAQRADNAILSFRESVGSALLPMQKFGNNFLAGFFNFIADGINYIKPLVHGFFIALFANLLRLEIFGQSIQKMLLGLLKLVWTIKGALGVFLAEMLLVAAAWKVWENVTKQLSDRFFPEINKEIDQLTRGLDAYRLAIAEAKGTTEDFNNTKLQLAEGWKLPDNEFGDVIREFLGSDYVNLDSLYNKPVNKILGNTFTRSAAQTGLSLVPGGAAALVPFIPKKQKTIRENKEEQLITSGSNLSAINNKILQEGTEAFNAAKEISKLNQQVSEIQSKRSRLLPSEKEALKASLKAERDINKEQDKYRKILIAHQQNLQTNIATNKSRLEEILEKRINGEIVQDTYESERNRITGELKDQEDQLNALNAQMAKVSNELSYFQRELKNSNERVEGFLSQSDRDLQQQRTGIVEAGLAEGAGTQVIQIELEEVQKQDLQRRINFLKAELTDLEKALTPEVRAGIARVKQRFADKKIPLSESNLQKFAEDINNEKSDKQAASFLLEELEKQTKLYGFQEQLGQTLQSNRNALIDFNRTIDDYFFRISQQIKEAQLEVLRIIDQIIQTNIRNKLTSALSPNADSFVNQLISSTQSLIDQAAQYAEKVLGQRGARIQFEGQQKSLQDELQDFARNVKGAGDALDVFTRKLSGFGGQKDNKSAPNLSENRSAESSNNLTALRRAIIGKESGANFKAVNPHSGALGYGQVMPANVASWTKESLGKSLTPQQFLNDADAQIKVIDYKLGQYLEGELKQGFDLDTAVRRVASTWYSGQPDLYNNARPQTYGAGNYPSIDSYTKDILTRFKSEGGGKVSDKAEKDTDYLISKEKQKLDLQDSLIKNQEKEALDIAIDNNIKSDRRKVDNQIVDSQVALTKLLDAGKELISQYDFQTAENEATKNVRAVNNAFSDRGLQISREITKYVDEINAINDIISLAPSQSKLLRDAGKNDEADILVEKAAQAQLLLKPYQDILSDLVEEYKNLTETAQTALDFVNAQNALKKEQEQLTKKNNLLGIKSNIAAQRGTLEQQRQLKLQQEELRLQLRLNEVRQQTKPGENLDKLIAGERSQSQINTENINYDSQIAELDLERQLLDLQGGISDKNAGFLSRYGFNLQGDKLRRENAIAQENLRYEQQLLELAKKYAGQPELLEEFTEKARELNRVNLEAINQQFKTLGLTVQDFGISAVQGFFTEFTTNFFNGEGARAELEERLRYAEEINQLENQYRGEENEGKLAHLKNRARELNEQKLDQINGQFNIFTRGVNLAKQALLEFIKQLAVMVAQQAAAKFLSSVLGGALGGAFGGGGVAAVGNDFGAGAGIGAFVADEGQTVGDIRSRKLSNPVTNWFRRNAPGVAKAWNSEGEGAQLGVFHTGEELLSRKTGEAGRYQALKAHLGINPLDKILNYSEGGTVGFDAEANILSGFSSSRPPRIDLSGIEGRGRRAEAVSKTVNVTQQIYTPNADSFNLSQEQRNQDLVESMRRGF